MTLSVVGLGKLGMCIASVLAVRGFKVIGVDINRKIIVSINSGETPFFEPKLQKYLALGRKNLDVSSNFTQAITDSDITFLIVPTPSLPDGNFSDIFLQQALKSLSLILSKSNKKSHLFSVVSTVSPGTIQEKLVPLIEKYSGKVLNRSFDICYNPSFIALGNVIDDFLSPDMVLVGENNRSAGDRLEAIYKKICRNKPYIARMSIINAEITKISLNSYITMKISFANNLANICEQIPGADIDKITGALGADKRISPYYLKGGLSYGGPCFPRDSRAFAAFAKEYGVEAKLAQATDEINKLQIKRLLKLIIDNLPKKKNVKLAILGVTYKSDTSVIEESAVIKIIEKMLKKRKDIEIMIYDDLSKEAVKKVFGHKITYADSIEECITDSALCLITSQSKGVKIIEKINFSHPVTIIDCWRLLDKDRLGGNVTYISLGRNLNG